MEIEATIRRFEPRFLSVRVTLIDAQDRLETTLRLRIEAVVHAEPAPEAVTFDTLVDPVPTMWWCGTAMWCEEEGSTRKPQNHGVARRSDLALRAKRLSFFLGGAPWFSVASVWTLPFSRPHRCLTPCSPTTNANWTRSNAWPRNLPIPIRRSPAGSASRPMRWTTRTSPACWRGGVSRRTRTSPAGRRIPRTDRCPARPALPALPGAGAVLHGGAVRLPARPDESRAAARGHRHRHRTGPRRGTPLPHDGARHAVAGRGRERPPVGPAARGACQPDRARRDRRAADHAEMRLPRGHLHPTRHRPAALLPARADEPGACPVRAARRARASRSHTPTTPWIPPRSSCPARAIEPAGFSPDEALLPWSARGFSGFRLLTEYFAFPDKFLFLDITGMDTKTLVSAGNRLEIFVYLDRSLPELERTDRPVSRSRSAARRW